MNIDSGDALSNHFKRSMDSSPEIKNLHLTNMLNNDVLKFIQSESKNFDGKHSTVILAPSVSEAFDVSILLQTLIGKQHVKVLYPHTKNLANNFASVMVIPVMTFQVNKELPELLSNVVNCFVIFENNDVAHLANIVKNSLDKMLSDCRCIQLKSMPISQNSEDKPKVVTKKVTKPVMKMIVEEAQEPESESIKEAGIEFIIEPIVEEQVEQSTIEDIKDENVSSITMDAADTQIPEGHHIVYVDRNFKRSYLRNRLKSSNKKTLIITRTRHNAHRLEEYLYQGKVRSRILHANLSEEAKDKIIERFVSGDLSVLLLPEAVAQTITLDCVDDIIFFDLPDVGIEFKERISLIGEKFGVENTSSLVTLDEIPWVESMEVELKWSLPKVQPAPPQRSHNILRIKNRTNSGKEVPENTEKRVGVNRGLRKLGGKNNLNKKRSNPVAKQPKDNLSDHNSISHSSDDPFNSVNQSIVNENRNPFAFDSFEASISRQNKQRVKQLFSRRDKPMKDIQNDFSVQKPERKSVKIVHRKKRTFDIDGNQ